MKNEESHSVHVIDNSIRNQMHNLDRQRENFFSDHFSFIMNFEPYREKVVFGRPTRTPEHRIVLVRKGSTTLNISCSVYTLKKNHLMVIPANSVLIKDIQSKDYNVFCIAFRIPEVEQLGLIDYKEKLVLLSEKDCGVVENYFLLMNQLISSFDDNQRGLNHLIISLLYSINSLYRKISLPVAHMRSDRAQEIMRGFIRLLLEQEYPVRKPGFYAEQLYITKGHLADIVKRKSKKTTMDWINERTILIAQAMLVSTEETLELIAEKLHFIDASQFVKFFKKHTGVTPNSYRKQIR